MTDTSQDTTTRPTAPRGLRPENRLDISVHDPCCIKVTGCDEADGPPYIVVDPYEEWPPTMEPHLYARTLAATWNACAAAGLTVDQLEAGAIKATMEENARLKDALAAAEHTIATTMAVIELNLGTNPEVATAISPQTTTEETMPGKP